VHAFNISNVGKDAVSTVVVLLRMLNIYNENTHPAAAAAEEEAPR
jgi:hypothetical protein